MAIKVKQLGGRSGNASSSGESYVLTFDAWDDSDRWVGPEALLQSVVSFAPPSFQGLGPTDITWDEDPENGHSEFEITYGSDEPAESILRFSFDTTGGTVRARTSRDTDSYPIASRTAPDYKHAVEVSGGTPQGVDIVIPALKIVGTYKWPKGVVTIADAKALAGQTGTTNDAPWYGFEAGELLFLGATGVIDLAVANEVQYQFAASANADVSIGTWIQNITKKGHQHLWVAFEDQEDTAAKKVVQRPLAAYVETMYLESDFEKFGIGK